jgi:sugar phosphate isomerase/epimerase
MIRLSAISDGISNDFARAATMLARAGLGHVELQSVWKKPVGDLDAAEIAQVGAIAAENGLRIACLSHKNLFGAMPVMTTQIGDANYAAHMDAMRRVIAAARALDTDLVRIMCFRKESVLFGSHGAETAVVSAGAWDKFVQLMVPPIRLAESEGIRLVVENSTKGMVTSAYLARRLVDDIGSPALKVLWDPSNALYFDEVPFPDGYADLRGGYLGHMHIKDSVADIRRARIDFAALGDGQMAPFLEPIADSLRSDGYDGFVSLESLYRPPGGGPEEGFLASLDKLKAIFGQSTAT